MTKKERERMTDALEKVTDICMSSMDCKGCPAKIGAAYCVRLAIWSTNKHQSDLKKYGDEDEVDYSPAFLGNLDAKGVNRLLEEEKEMLNKIKKQGGAG